MTPDWVPPLIVSVAGAMRAFNPEIVDRLLTDPRMKGVWRSIGGREVEALPADLPDNRRADNWLGQVRASPKDQAAVAFFTSAVITFAIGNPTVREGAIAHEARRWRIGAALCREALSGMHRATVDPHLAAALRMSADYFEGFARSVETASAGSPYVIGRNSRKRAPGGGNERLGDENVRGQVCDLAEVTRKIFGSVLRGPVASVATGLDIQPKSVENWSTSTPRFPNNELSR